jgi:hypothetical protein
MNIPLPNTVISNSKSRSRSSNSSSSSKQQPQHTYNLRSRSNTQSEQKQNIKPKQKSESEKASTEMINEIIDWCNTDLMDVFHLGYKAASEMNKYNVNHPFRERIMKLFAQDHMNNISMKILNPKTKHIIEAIQSFTEKAKNCLKILAKEFDRTSSHLLRFVRNAYQLIFTLYINGDFQTDLIGHLFVNMYYIYLLDKDTKDDDMRVMFSVTRGSGVVLTKIFQKFAGFNDVEPKISEALRQCYDNNPKITEEQFKEIKPKLLNPIILKEDTFNNDPIAVASIGQVHKVKTVNDEELVLKFIKPSAIVFLYYEYFLLYKTSTASKDVKNYCMKMFSEILNEFSFKNEESNMNLGHSIYESAKENIHTITPFKYTFPTDYNKEPFPCIIMSTAPGVSLKSIISNKRNINVHTYQDLIELFKKLIIKWIFNGLITNGYAHLDLHPGNLMVNIVNDVPSITLVDFGNFIKVSKKTQCKILKILLIFYKIIYMVKNEVKIKESKYESVAKDILNNIKVLCELEDDINKDLIVKIVAFFKSDKYSSFNSLFDIIIENLTSLGACSNNDVFELIKGIGMLESTWEMLCKSSQIQQNTFIEVIVYELTQLSAKNKFKVLFKRSTC